MLSETKMYAEGQPVGAPRTQYIDRTLVGRSIVLRRIILTRRIDSENEYVALYRVDEAKATIFSFQPPLLMQELSLKFRTMA